MLDIIYNPIRNGIQQQHLLGLQIQNKAFSNLDVPILDDYSLSEWQKLNVEEYCKKHEISMEIFEKLRRQVIESNKVKSKRGIQLLDELNTRQEDLISIGCSGIDDLLSGGLHPGEITEISGESTAGKTRLCYAATLMTTCSVSNNTVFYIDTLNSFSPEAMFDLFQESDRFIDARDRGMENVFQRIRLPKNGSDIFDVFSVIEGLRQELQRKSEDAFYFNLKLIVLDSIAPLFLPILGGYADEKANSLMTNLIRMLRNLAREHQIVILITNSVETVRPTNPMSAFSSTITKPALKMTWTYMPDTTLFLILGEYVGSKQRFYINQQGNQIWGKPRVCEVLRSHTRGCTEFFPISV
ncbi:4153_t:CDS:10 [Diversispora eburnea]|uniref:4153_t:CDS:1 n=1 Tax=Diversispora eburnea TaxID=1213867 RepID=A0A9N8YJU8_9GLOM|nr:4153_t:CDS:10 [Diversispora eburnea]